MGTWEFVGNILGALCFLAWVPWMISVVRRGISIPLFVHILAAVTTGVGVGCLIGLAVGGIYSLTLTLLLGLLPAACSYVGWFWLFGPEWSKQPESES